MMKMNDIRQSPDIKAWVYSLGPGSLEHFRPGVRLEELRVEVRRELGVSKTRGIILQHKSDVCGLQWSLPVPPEPLTAERRHREHPPMHEQPELGLVVPLRQRSGVQAFPVRFVLLPTDQHAARCAEQQPQAHRLIRRSTKSGAMQSSFTINCDYPLEQEILSQGQVNDHVTHTWEDNKTYSVTRFQPRPDRFCMEVWLIVLLVIWLFPRWSPDLPGAFGASLLRRFYAFSKTMGLWYLGKFYSTGMTFARISSLYN